MLEVRRECVGVVMNVKLLDDREKQRRQQGNIYNETATVDFGIPESLKISTFVLDGSGLTFSTFKFR